MTTQTRDKIKFEQDADGFLTPHSRQTATEVAFPEQWIANSDNTALTAGAIGRTCWTSSDLSAYNSLTIEVVAAPTGTTPILQLYPTVDGTNYAATPLAFLNLATGAIIAGATGLNAIGIYAVLSAVGGGLKIRGAKMLLNGGAADVAIAASAVRFLSGNV